MEKRSRAQERWAARRAKGLCGQCGVVPSVKFSRCDLCRGFVNEQRKRWYHRPKVHSHECQKRAVYREQNRELLRQRQRNWYWDNHEKALMGLRESYRKRSKAA